MSLFQRQLIGLARDLRGIAFAFNTKISYMMLFDWLYPSFVKCFLSDAFMHCNQLLLPLCQLSKLYNIKCIHTSSDCSFQFISETFDCTFLFVHRNCWHNSDAAGFGLSAKKLLYLAACQKQKFVT